MLPFGCSRFICLALSLPLFNPRRLWTLSGVKIFFLFRKSSAHYFSRLHLGTTCLSAKWVINILLYMSHGMIDLDKFSDAPSSKPSSAAGKWMSEKMETWWGWTWRTGLRILSLACILLDAATTFRIPKRQKAKGARLAIVHAPLSSPGNYLFLGKETWHT